MNEQVPNDGTRRIRVDRFTTATRERRHQFTCWRELVAPLVEVDRNEPATAGYHASARAYDLGPLHFVASCWDSMQYRHTREHVRASGIDHWYLTLLKRGNDISRAGDRVLRSSAGDLQVRSFAFPFSGRCDTTNSISLYLSRDNFPDISGMLDAVDHKRIAGSYTEILGEYIIALENYLKTLQISEISLVVETFTHLLSAALKPTAKDVAAADIPMEASRFSLARKHIQQHLTSPDLGTDSLCRALEISRRQLYHLFEKHGGVAKFIKKRRLAACCKAIGNPADHRLISTIAYSYGFTNHALFSRQFQAEYGFSPSEARAARLCGHLPEPSPPKTFSEWLLQTRGT